jgi:uncharacterized phage protein (TIGR01671 family)
MRAILFRGKRKDTSELNGEWDYGYGVYNVYIPDRPQPCLLLQEHESYIIHAETIGQCTWLKDKNGKCIFEGDIVEYKTMRLPVRYSEEYACFTVDDKFWMSAHNEFKVIGNIHDHPELLN